MRKKRKRNKKRLPIIPLFFIVLAAAVGFNVTKTLEGMGIGIITYFVLYIGFIIWLKTRKIRKLRKSGIREVDQMSGEDFEKFLGELFKRRGFKVRYTATSGDYGADLILKDGKDIIAVQAKRYSSTVGVKAVQEIIGAVKMYEATEAWVVTNSHFTRQAEKLADINDVYLIDRDELIQIILNKR
ncbi:restriction endonuclease [Solibacillus sp. A46]|uniref:Restriction endonuclease n=1 Tax=Solibacillus faecavium TaxID=2762221 RepID=A0ABR8Y228_9BACL|nr:restriction endonuclease [Solibacillus faecavium]MBD8038257.1 restriction endonuclease [Solibacillus faecavium]